jgi:hypothetical protein
MATAETIREAKRAQPFRPFSLRLVDGTIYDVKHPDFITIPPVCRPREALYFELSNGNDEYNSRWIDLGLIMEVVVSGAPAAMPGPGAEPDEPWSDQGGDR